MSERLDGKRVAILVANEGIEQVELTGPQRALDIEAGKPVAAICDIRNAGGR